MVIVEDLLGIDPRDRLIIDMVSKNPSIPQQEIARKINLSQPSVGARLSKLKEKGIISVVSGTNFKTVKLAMAKVEVSASDTEKVLESFEKCPFFINGLVMSGTYNLSIFLTAPTIKELEEVVNYHLRNHEYVNNLRMDIVIKPIKDLVLPVSFDISGCKDKKEFKDKCRVCPVRQKVFS